MHLAGGVTTGLTSVVDKANDRIDQITTLNDTWQPLLSKLKSFTELVDNIAEVRPYAKMSWNVLSAAHKMILAQGDRDDHIKQIYKIMDGIYANVIQAEASKIESHKQVIACMAQQSIACGYFITSYAKDKNFWMQLVKNSMSGADTAIKSFQDKFEDLKKGFHEEAIRSTEISILHTEIIVESILDEVDLKDLPYANDARFRSDKQCLAGTREEILDEITDWINNSDHLQKVFLLCGAAGTGKSAIAHTIANRFKVLGHLGSSYCFIRSDQANRHPGNVFSTVAVNLSDHNAEIKDHLHKIIHRDRSLRTTQDVMTQFRNFILMPTENITVAGPIVIVIDALDESGDCQSRSGILAVLAKEMAGLPTNFRILLTSRLEDDIQKYFNRNNAVLLKNMNRISERSTNLDIFSYIRSELSDVSGKPMEEFDDVKCQVLTKKSEHLFQWAFVACGFIKGVNGKAGSTPIKRYNSLFQDATTSHHKGFEPLYQLYSDILSQLFDPDDVEVMAHFTSVMGKIISAFEPLSIDSLSAIQNAANGAISRNDVISIIQFMGSLLSGVTEVDNVKYIRPLHTSFGDFLTNKLQSGDFYVDVSKQHAEMSQACLNIMKEDLKFNICKIKSSYQLNKDIPNLNELIMHNITQQLFYACKYWIHHCQEISFDSTIERKVENFLYKQFLYWLEVLSVHKKVNVASDILSLTLDKTGNNNVKCFLKDAMKFLFVFGNVMAQSVPHIYLSGLPFAPVNSVIAQHYLPKFSHTIVIQTGKMSDWPVLQNVLRGHTDTISSVAFSPDGKHIVSGSWDKTI
ncbi:hypothetical protein BD410DRAFT_867429, partial [Rickenella mellea]